MVSQRHQLKMAMTAGVAAEWYVHAIADDGKLTFEDLDETVVAAGLLAGIWSEELFGLAGWTLRIPIGTVALGVTGILAAGIIPAYIVGGKEGVHDYLEFITEPEKIIDRTLEVTIKTLYPRVVQEIFEFKVAVDKKVTGFISWVGKEIDEFGTQVEEAKQGLPSWARLPW